MNHNAHTGEHGEGEHGPTFGTHGMLLVGEQTVYLSHLPMFMLPHNLQMILEVTLTDGQEDPQAIYVHDRRHTGTKLYTLNPMEDFELIDLAPADATHSPRRSSFKGAIYRNHFERPNPAHPEAPPHVELANATVHIANVCHFHELQLEPPADPLPQLQYLLFGKGQELFLAHWITRRGDFDQVLSAKVTGHDFTDRQLRRGVVVTFPGRENSIPMKLKEGEQVAGSAQAVGQHGSRTFDVQVETDVEFYFEADELR
jgi:hypothetical protein